MTVGPYECNACGAEVTAHGNTDTCSRCASVVRPQPHDDVTRELIRELWASLAASIDCDTVDGFSQPLDEAVAAYRAVHGEPP